VLSGKEVNTNFSHWFYPNGEQTRSLIHLSRAISSTSPGRSYALIDIHSVQGLKFILISRFQMPPQHEAYHFYTLNITIIRRSLTHFLNNQSHLITFILY